MSWPGVNTEAVIVFGVVFLLDIFCRCQPEISVIVPYHVRCRNTVFLKSWLLVGATPWGVQGFGGAPANPSRRLAASI